MSATIGNLNELATFMNADIYHKDFRPVELREHVKSGSEILEIKKNAPTIESAFEMVRTVNFSVMAEHLRKYVVKLSDHKLIAFLFFSTPKTF